MLLLLEVLFLLDMLLLLDVLYFLRCFFYLGCLYYSSCLGCLDNLKVLSGTHKMLFFLDSVISRGVFCTLVAWLTSGASSVLDQS